MKWFLILFAVLAVACVEDTTPQDSQTLDFAGGPADSIQEPRVRADGMTVWADAHARNDLLTDRWLIGGRTSHSIEAISATIKGEPAEVVTTSARKFELRLSPQQLTANLADEPALVEVITTSGKTYTINLGLSARFRNTSGSTSLYVWQNITPVVTNGELTFRGRVTTRGEFETLTGSNDDDSEPLSWKEDTTHWVLDFPQHALVWAASPTEDALNIHGQKDGRDYARRAEIHVELSRLGVTNASPEIVWPTPTCAETTQKCIDDAGPGADLEACGRARDVLACDLPADPVADLQPWKDRFADDLRKAIIQHYAAHGPDIVQAGGNTQQQALLAVDTAQMDEVTDSDEDPEAHDFSAVRVFRHPDMTFPGSDIVWFGAYERQTGNLINIYDFN